MFPDMCNSVFCHLIILILIGFPSGDNLRLGVGPQLAGKEGSRI
jgi:hypothetical protein